MDPPRQPTLASTGTAPPARPADTARPPWWPPAVGLLLCVLGFGVAGYLTYEHYTASSSLSCPAGGGAIDCLKVTSSSYSMIRGVPVAVLGLVFFAVMAAFQSPPAWRSRNPLLRSARMGWSVMGVGTALWLIYAELFRIDAICLWCTAVHILSILVFFTTVFATLAMSDRLDLGAD